MDLILIVLIIALPLLAQLFISVSYSRYSKILNNKKLSGKEVARIILDNNNLNSILIYKVSGNLTDHYDPTKKLVRLSNDIYENDTISSMAVAAHECGHAIQDSEDYFFLKLRSSIYPVVRVATSISYWIILFGFLFELLDLLYLGIGFTMFGLLFQIITLPVEFNASNRALKKLKEYNLVDEDELKGARKVLTAAALTYVAGTLASALQILRLILIANSSRD